MNDLVAALMFWTGILLIIATGIIGLAYEEPGWLLAMGASGFLVYGGWFELGRDKPGPSRDARQGRHPH